jgi:biopolymer transport protein ExbB
MRMNMTIRIVLLLSLLFPLLSQAAPVNVDALLKLVKEGQARDDQEFRERLNAFAQSKAEQEKLLQNAKFDRATLENRSAAMENDFSENEIAITREQERLNQRLGSLKELFGVLQQSAGDTRGILANSVTSAEVAGRDEFLAELVRKSGSSTTLPAMEELERLWFEMQQEITLSGQVSRFPAQVVLPGGETVEKQVVRIGSFNLVSGGNYLQYDTDTRKVVELASQPSGRYTSSVSDLESASAGLVDFWVDPSRGHLLTLLGQSATFMEQVQQGGLVGYVIMVLALFGFVVAGVRLFTLSRERNRILQQIKQPVANENNSLGRVMAVYQRYANVDVETLELHLAEAISAEVPRLTQGIGWIKIVAVSSPLLGLLGTVTGMIDVFETMALFGTGDPKLMAGGISQALVTTVQGLVAAIPCVFLHAITNNRSRELVMILEERATGILARKTESAAA